MKEEIEEEAQGTCKDSSQIKRFRGCSSRRCRRISPSRRCKSPIAVGTVRQPMRVSPSVLCSRYTGNFALPIQQEGVQVQPCTKYCLASRINKKVSFSNTLTFITFKAGKLHGTTSRRKVCFDYWKGWEHWTADKPVAKPKEFDLPEAIRLLGAQSRKNSSRPS